MILSLLGSNVTSSCSTQDDLFAMISRILVGTHLMLDYPSIDEGYEIYIAIPNNDEDIEIKSRKEALGAVKYLRTRLTHRDVVMVSILSHNKIKFAIGIDLRINTIESLTIDERLLHQKGSLTGLPLYHSGGGILKILGFGGESTPITLHYRSYLYLGNELPQNKRIIASAMIREYCIEELFRRRTELGFDAGSNTSCVEFFAEEFMTRDKRYECEEHAVQNLKPMQIDAIQQFRLQYAKILTTAIGRVK